MYAQLVFLWQEATRAFNELETTMSYCSLSRYIKEKLSLICAVVFFFYANVKLEMLNCAEKIFLKPDMLFTYRLLFAYQLCDWKHLITVYHIFPGCLE